MENLVFWPAWLSSNISDSNLLFIYSVLKHNFINYLKNKKKIKNIFFSISTLTFDSYCMQWLLKLFKEWNSGVSFSFIDKERILLKMHKAILKIIRLLSLNRRQVSKEHKGSIETQTSNWDSWLNIEPWIWIGVESQ